MVDTSTNLINSQNKSDELITIDELQYAKFFLGIAEKLNGTKRNLSEFIKSERETRHDPLWICPLP
jgi:hypothetical protein